MVRHVFFWTEIYNEMKQKKVGEYFLLENIRLPLQSSYL